MGTVGLLGGWDVRIWRKEKKINGEFSIPLFEN